MTSKSTPEDDQFADPTGAKAVSLPGTLPIFPLAGVLLLPGADLPLNIFEPRYLAMTRDAMRGARLIGMVQPLDPETEGGLNPPVYQTGCAGRITTFDETDDGRFVIKLTGVCRFSIVDELPMTESDYRQVRVAYEPFGADIEHPGAGDIDRERLLKTLGDYLERGSYQTDWEAIKRAPTERLVTSLAMICPFAPNEKQALLEARDGGERADVMIALMEMSAHGDPHITSESLQ